MLKYVLSTCKTLFLESCTASTTMFSLLIPYLAPFFGIFHPRHQITGGNITYIHSTHTPHVGRDYLQISPSYQFGHFYSHASCEARLIPDHSICTERHFYSLAPCGARRIVQKNVLSWKMISTHSPHAGRDKYAPAFVGSLFKFLLTRPMRGATGK